MYLRSKGSSETDPALIAPVSVNSGLTDTLNTESTNESTTLRFIPEFTDGNETDLASFIARCDFAHLRTIFGTSHSVQYLQAQLSSMRQGPKEMVKDFAQRIEKTYHELTHALTVGKTNTEAKIIAQTVQSHALSVFISGVSQAIQIILLARNITNFEEAILIGMEQEKTFGIGGEVSKVNESNNKNNFKGKSSKTGEKIDKSKIKYFRCDKMGHYANECKTPEQ
ncbi:hypothetical protein AGLY_018227 [Aphis glycines]|uniref:CCHC-type domain-containing protein n=1 Tax=Aphis glycines TaxID=307491 RepID=A0A6G0STI3_APHGL|nr:hypothetical protein AGLY_018227 [Aphis glycines]